MTTSTSTQIVWRVSDPIFTLGPEGGLSVKDPSIVFHDGLYHLFYTLHVTARAVEIWYAAAPRLEELNEAPRSRVCGGCAPQVFYFEDTKQWFLIQNSTHYSTNDRLGADGWVSRGNLCSNTPVFPPDDPNGPIDPWVIMDETTAFLFYARDNGTISLTMQPRAIFPSPDEWTPHQTIIAHTRDVNGKVERDSRDIFEAIHIYHSRADGMYYLQVEGLGAPEQRARKFALYRAPKLGAGWELVSNEWAIPANLRFEGQHWTTQVSHPEAIRTHTTQNVDIDDIHHSYWIVMGVTQEGLDGAQTYGAIPWVLGLMHNSNGELRGYDGRGTVQQSVSGQASLATKP